MLSDEAFRQLLHHLDRPWAGFRKVRKGVKKRVRRHMQSLGCTGIDPYLACLARDPAARQACESCLVVTISRFYRDRRLWEHLQTTVLPLLIHRFPNGLTAWSAGCAGGEEPYSLAMLWEEMAAAGQPRPALHLLATDAAASGLERAAAGRYPASSLKEMPEPLKNRWFHKAPGGRQWRIDARLHDRIHWRLHQLLDPPPRGPFHLIFLRNNLLTYYRGAPMEAALGRILSTLAPGGALILGAHERMPGAARPMRRDEGCPWTWWAE